MGVASLVLGIISIVLGVFGFGVPVGAILGIVGTVLGSMAKKNDPANSLAKSGFVCSVVGTAISLAFFVACVGCAGCATAGSAGLLSGL
ncbi:MULTISPECIES: hypothetical protein [Anaerostipes]|uniref:DUF4190 domain-containing protein n=1 Tax=Anaerostipes butyraticus TaxID=645466 RepID=A0A916Q4H0_9FIRM|nr:MULTISPECIES: hypothetical protein [Anaerostipes]GFO84244.1 hypothetical protein ANBU17_05910 [Anaerostipes butyraticus]